MYTDKIYNKVSHSNQINHTKTTYQSQHTNKTKIFFLCDLQTMQLAAEHNHCRQLWRHKTASDRRQQGASTTGARSQGDSTTGSTG